MLASSFEPPPPDLSEFALSPDRDFKVISLGYPGTQMPAFDDLPTATRWGLVKLVRDFYHKPADEK